MIEKIIEWSVRNKLIVVSLSLIVLGASIWALKNTPLDAIPDLSPPQVIVYTKWQGQSFRC